MDKDKIDLLEAHSNGLAEGRRLEREHIMDGAVEAEVCGVIIHGDGDEVHYSVKYPIGKRPCSINDKVKVIVIKED